MSEPAQVQISKDLAEQISSLRALVTVHNLLGTGTFQFKDFEALQKSLGFISNLHGMLADAALKDPQASMVRELVDLKNARAEQKVNPEDLAKNSSENQGEAKNEA